MQLADFYAVIAPYLEGQADLATTRQALFGDTPPRDVRRLAIYARFCRLHRLHAVGGVHRVLRDVVLQQAGEAAWQALVEAYFQQHPMQHVEINENGEHLAAFLAGRADLPPWWSALADFEWWEWQTYIAPDSDADARPDAGPLRLASTVELRPYAWDLLDWLDSDGERAAEPEPQPVLVLFWRDRDLAVRRERATMAELVLLKRVSEGLATPPDDTFADLHAAGIVLGAPSDC